ncbi:MAG: hypothetical protein ACKO37_05490 [Vampirovibrionales bacterium]
MTTWKDVGDWITRNAGDGASLVGSLLSGNLPAAVGKGIAMVSGATGSDKPERALEVLKTDPATIIKLRELANQENASIRSHIATLEEMRLKDAQENHSETQETIRAGDVAQDIFVRSTRPGMAWTGLLGSIAYVTLFPTPNDWVFNGLMILPYTYMGFRAFDKNFSNYLKHKKGKKG